MPTKLAGTGTPPVAILTSTVSIALLVVLLLLLAGPVRAQGLEGSAVLALDGVDDYATGPDGPAYDLGTGATDDFTLETLFRVPASTATQTGTLFIKNLSYDFYILFNVGGGEQDRVIFRLRSGASSIVAYHSVTLAEGWHHAAAVFDNEYMETGDLQALYVDGNLVSAGSGVDWTPGLPNTTSALNIGGYLGINSFPGWLEETRISNTVRYSGSSYIVPAAPFSSDANTVALWHFNETPGSTAFLDSSGAANDLSGFNGAVTYNADAIPPTTTDDADDLWHQTPSPCTSRPSTSAARA